MLFWNSLRDALPVGTRLEDRHISIDPQCKRCANPESIIHLFYQCKYANSRSEDTRSNKTAIGHSLSTILRTDAAWNGTSMMAGLGWIIKQNEETSSFSTLDANVATPLMAEGLALRAELYKNTKIGIENLIVESDSKSLINNIRDSNSVPELYGVVADILCITCTFLSISFRWISRLENTDADLLAKKILCVNEAFMTSI